MGVLGFEGRWVVKTSLWSFSFFSYNALHSSCSYILESLPSNGHGSSSLCFFFGWHDEDDDGKGTRSFLPRPLFSLFSSALPSAINSSERNCSEMRYDLCWGVSFSQELSRNWTRKEEDVQLSVAEESHVFFYTTVLREIVSKWWPELWDKDDHEDDWLLGISTAKSHSLSDSRFPFLGRVKHSKRDRKKESYIVLG